MTALLWVSAALALLPALNTLINLYRLRTPALPAGVPGVAILIPARDEETTIGPCIEAALGSVGADIEVIVLDDGSHDRTREVVAARASRDPRLRLASAPPLPPGVKGKPHACQVLAGMAERPYLLFVDADVRLAPTAAARLVPPAGIDLVSAVPRQRVRGFVETAVIPMINTLIFGYLPLQRMRTHGDPSLAVACGQLVMVRAEAYRACGGHAAIATYLHDGLQLARLFRRHGLRTDLVDGSALAECRMYEGARAVFRGFAKNATEGMARPLVLPMWTVLLAGGQVLPVVLAADVLITGRGSLAGAVTVAASVLLILARIGQAIKCREPIGAVLLHPLGVLLALAVQWYALYRHARGRRVTWRGRSYVTTTR